MKSWPFTIALLAVFAVPADREPQARDSTLSPFARAKAEALLRDQLPCLGCHALRGEGGRIGPDLTTVRERRSADAIAAMVADPQATVPGTAMPRVPMPGSVRALIVAYLASTASRAREAPVTPSPLGKTSATASSPAAVPTSGVRGPAPVDPGPLYARFCAACHGASGAGNGPNAQYLPVPPAQLNAAARMSERSDDALFDTIHGGGLIMNRSPRMPPFGQTLTRDEIRALVRHIRSLCRCEGPSWSRDGAR